MNKMIVGGESKPVPKSIARALHTLGHNAQACPEAVQAEIHAFAQKNPTGFQAIVAALKAAGLEATGTSPSTRAVQTDAFCAPEFGRLYDGKGVYMGEWRITDTVIAPLYVAPDLERTDDGKQVQWTFVKQVDEFAKRNGGRRYGDGCVEAIAQAIIDNTYHEGDFFHGPLEFMNGKNVQGDVIREVNVVSQLMAANPAFAGIWKDMTCGHWPFNAFSGTVTPDSNMYIYTVILSNGGCWGHTKHYGGEGVLPFRAFGIKRLAL